MLAVLMEYRKQDTTETFQILDEENIKEAFLQWIYNEKKVLWFRNDDEDFYFHWHVDHLEKGSVTHSVEIIDKVNQERVYEEH